MTSMTSRSLLRLLPLVLLVAVGACRARPTTYVPPRVALAPHVRIGLVTFTTQGARGELAPLATQRFAAAMLEAQPGLEILELGTLEGPVDAARARALGEQHGLRSVVVGQLVVSDVKPRVSILGGLRASVEATVALTTRLLVTESGSTIWTRSARLTETLAGVSLVEGQAVFGAQDAEEAYGEMVQHLVWELTQDFRGSWVR